MSRALALVAVAVALGACSVDGSFLDEQLFPCVVDSDCGDDWGCALASPYAEDFCAPLCGDSCDGTCVVQGDQSLCLGGCRILDDGTTSECQSPELSCVRVSADTDNGVCYPVDGCSLDDECPEDQACLSQLPERLRLNLPVGGLRFDNLYCIPSVELVGSPGTELEFAL